MEWQSAAPQSAGTKLEPGSPRGHAREKERKKNKQTRRKLRQESAAVSRFTRIMEKRGLVMSGRRSRAGATRRPRRSWEKDLCSPSKTIAEDEKLSGYDRKRGISFSLPPPAPASACLVKSNRPKRKEKQSKDEPEGIYHDLIKQHQEEEEHARLRLLI